MFSLGSYLTLGSALRSAKEMLGLVGSALDRRGEIA